MFDAIYTGTETRNAEFGQRLQSYQSYLQTQYFNNIKPGGNQGGWIDGGGDARYAEQFWDTFFAKVPEIVLFNSMQIMRGLAGGNRTFIVQNFRAQPVSTRIWVTGATRIRNLLTDETLAGSQGGGGGRAGRGNFGGPSGTSFEVTVPGHSFRVFAAE